MNRDSSRRAVCLSGKLSTKIDAVFSLLVGDGHTVVIRTCSVTDWGSQCGDIFFEQGDKLEKLSGCLATCNFDGCNGAVATSRLRPECCFIAVALTAVIVALQTVINMDLPYNVRPDHKTPM